MVVISTCSHAVIFVRCVTIIVLVNLDMAAGHTGAVYATYFLAPDAVHEYGALTIHSHCLPAPLR